MLAFPRARPADARVQQGFVAPEGSPLLPETPSGAERSHKKGGGSTASIVLKRTKTGGAKFVLKHKSSKSARAYKKRYTSGPPLVPAFIANRVVEYTKRLKFAKRPQFINQVCRYWSLKREARRGAPLLKRLHLEVRPSFVFEFVLDLLQKLLTLDRR